MKIVKQLLFFLIVSLMVSHCYASMLQSVTYDDIRAMDGTFKGRGLSKVASIQHSDTNLTQDELTALTTSDQVVNVHTLDLSNQPNLTDEHIVNLAKNPQYARLSQLYLSGTNISDAALHELSRSPYIGSVRDLPQVSGRYGIPSTTLYIRLAETPNVSETLKRKTLENFDIKIRYFPPNPNVQYRPAENAVKFVEFSY